MKQVLIISLFMLSSFILKSQNWTRQISNTTEYLMSVDFLNDNTGIIVGGGGTILKTGNGGRLWEKINVSFSNFLYGVCYINDTMVISVGEAGGIFKSVDGGNTWQNIPVSGITVDLFGLDITANGKGLVVGNYETILWTEDYGDTWEIKRTDYWGNDNNAQMLNDTEGYIFGTNAIPEPLISWSADAFESLNFRDFYPFVENVGYLGYLQDGFIKDAFTGIFVGITETGPGFVTSAMKMGMQEWDATLYPQQFYTVDCKNNDCYVGGRNNMDQAFFLESDDFGENWTEHTLNKVSSVIQCVKILDNAVFAVGSNGVILKKQLNVGIDIRNSNLKDIRIFPNPVNTTIHFSSILNANISIYDLHGKLLITKKITGNQMDVGSLPEGIYCIKIATFDRVVTKKLIKQ